MDTQIIANEIDKFLTEKKPKISKVYKPLVEVEDCGLKPRSLVEHHIDNESIVQSSVSDGLCEFAGTGVMKYVDAASGISRDVNVSFHGMAQTQTFNCRTYVSAVEFDRITPATPIVPEA